jgi:RNA polymerase sigma factor (sigma-70 family)
MVMQADKLVRLAMTGDTAAFGILVRRNQSSVRNLLLRLTRGNHALADDLSQDTFVQAHAKIRQFSHRGSFSGWLYAIAWSRFQMEARKRTLDSLEDGYDKTMEFEADSNEKLDLEKALMRLSAPQRAALTLCFTLEMSHEEAALVLRLPLGTLKSHVTRGRERLKSLFETQDDR